MELKNAVTVCLISLFSATLVVLIARSLDSQAASRLEPQLARIVEELHAIRAGGGVATTSGEGASSRSRDDALVVYYFHGDRCPTCRAAEANARSALEAAYASQLQSGEIVWKVLDYLNDPEAKAMAVEFDVLTASVVLVKMKDGRIDAVNLLDRTLELAEDGPAFAAYLQGEINEMLPGVDGQSPNGGSAAADLPLPTEPSELPLP